MAKQEYVCSACGYKSASWFGKCPECGGWDTLEKIASIGQSGKNMQAEKAVVVSLANVDTSTHTRIQTGLYEFDRVLGGGFVPGEVLLLSGEPGVGKSTLLLEALQKLRVLYVSGEESPEQVKQRAKRLGVDENSFLFSSNTQIESIIKALDEDHSQNVDVVVIDSIQMVYSPNIPGTPGGATQIKEVTSQLVEYAKRSHVPILIIGHITKEGTIAGPKTLEHLVDCVLYLEGERFSANRIIRAQKNRFGTTDEIGVFEMNEKGLKEISNPMQFLQKDTSATIGKAIIGVVEGSRSLFFEVQTLVVPSFLPSPRRVVSGLDYNKVLLLLAVLQKNLSLSLDKFDVYVSIAGGVSTKSTASDLGVCASIVSSFKNVPIKSNTVFVGEVSLLGEVRPAYQQKKLLKDAQRYGFSTMVSNESLKRIKDLVLSLKSS